MMDNLGPNGNRGRNAFAIVTLAALTAALNMTVAVALEPDTEQLADLSLEELLNMEITTLSRKTENLRGAPAAVHVISQSDIRRSGARTIPDLLRMVPGMQVAQIDGNKWAVTARGANGRFANKLLVLMDGRTLYTPLLSGVYWDVHDTDLAEIERIEVIRGPGATMWGSNAVNGVVNIITRNAADTEGGRVSLLAADGESTEGVVSYAGRAGDAYYRVYAKALDQGGNVDLSGADTNDYWKSTRVGARADWSNDGSELTLSGGAYSGKSGESRVARSVTPPYESVIASQSDVSGSFALLRWSRDLAAGSNLQIRSYYSNEVREGYTFQEERDTVDLDIQHRLELSPGHDLMWGLAYRQSSDSIDGTFEVRLDPANRTQRLLSGFIQDDIALFDERVRLIFGSKFEHSNLSHRELEIEPSVRVSLAAGEYSTLWTAVSRAARIPSRGEQDGMVVQTVLPPGQPALPLPVPLVAVIQGSDDVRSEEVTAYELGFRHQSDDLILDVALFYNDYEHLRNVRPGLPTCQPGGAPLPVDPACLLTAQYVVSPFVVESRAQDETYGVEVSVSKQLADWWRVQGGYTSYRNAGDGNSLELEISEDSPDHQFSLRSSMDLPRNLQLDLWARWVDQLESQQIDAYTALDLRLTWSPTPRLGITAAGRNLLAGTHQEFMSELNDLFPVQIEAEGYVKLTWSF